MSKALYQTAAIKQLEKIAMSQGITEAMLMERAGEAAWGYFQTVWPDVRKVTVCCGGGNNGGDGFVVARLARRSGCDVKIISVGSYKNQSETARHMQQQCQDLGINIVPFTKGYQINDTDIIVDAILGTGLSSPLSGDVLDAVIAMNESQIPIFALDVPTGINADTGEVMGAAVNAKQTITFIALKVGLVTGPALNHIGNLLLATLNLPQVKPRPTPIAAMYDSAPLFLPKRQRDSHKGLFGHVVIIGGNYGMPGAPRIAAAAALRSGAGRVTVITRHEHAITMNIGMPEIMCTGVGSIADMPENIESATVWVIGPGLGHDQWTTNMMNYVLKQKAPLVIDADGLRWLAKNSITPRDNWVLTPHPGEVAALLNIQTEEIQRNRLNAAIALQQRYGGVAILKGAGSIIATKDNFPHICVNAGNSGMASAGMGDSLSGIIAALIAQQLPLFEAATLAVWVHARAGDLAAAEGGERGLLASDLLPHVRKLLNKQI
jgi:NAD(P)H-hydrate epimerase